MLNQISPALVTSKSVRLDLLDSRLTDMAEVTPHARDERL